MKWATFSLRAAFFIALAVALISIPVENSYRSRAEMYQRVAVSDEAALFGEAGEKVGSPQMMVVDDPKAVIAGGESGVKLLDDRYLQSNGIYPLQLQTVEFFGGLARMIGGGVALLSLAVLLAMRWRSAKAETGVNPIGGA